MRGIGFQRGGDGPLKRAAVGDAVGEGADGDHVLGGPAQEQQGDLVAGVGGPGYGVGGSGGDDLAEAWFGDGVAGGGLGGVGGGDGGGEGREEREGGGEEELHFDGLGFEVEMEN